MIDFCCEDLLKEHKELRDKNLVNHSIVYNQRNRYFAIIVDEEFEQRDRDMIKKIYYCPWCGAKFPKELFDEWYDILEKEYGIEDPIHTDRKKVPAEFWSDKWWKKRGL